MTHGMFQSKTNDWLTPPRVLAMAEAYFGTIDLDPCASRLAPTNVPAENHYTVDDNGLEQPWRGRVFVNPPYGRDVRHWVQKAMREVHAGRCEVMLLVAARTDTTWFQPLLRYPVAFMSSRIRFIDAETRTWGGSPAFPSAVVLVRQTFDVDVMDAFARAIGPAGKVVHPWGAI